MIRIEFKGWFQCRLATDLDHWTEKRGKNGWTFAYGNEPDLDRIIRFQNPIAPRSRCPAIGVHVARVMRDSGDVAHHPLLGTPVHLGGSPVFDGRSGEIAASATEPIVPFELEFRTGSAWVRAFDPIDISDRNEVERRSPQLETRSVSTAEATRIIDYAAYRSARKALLDQDLAAATDPAERQILQGRIHRLQVGRTIEQNSLGFRGAYRFELRGPNQWKDPSAILGSAPAQGSEWIADFWMGAWDADALSGFTKGAISIG